MDEHASFFVLFLGSLYVPWLGVQPLSFPLQGKHRETCGSRCFSSEGFEWVLVETNTYKGRTRLDGLLVSFGPLVVPFFQGTTFQLSVTYQVRGAVPLNRGMGLFTEEDVQTMFDMWDEEWRSKS